MPRDVKFVNMLRMAKGVLFSGQGAQQIGMGRSLYEQSSQARELWQEADAILGFSLTKLCFEGPEASLTETKVCQPALYVHGYVLYQFIKDQDIQVASGLSLGELTAHAAAGTYNFETGLRVVAERGRLMQEACEKTSGTMASIIGGAVNEVEELCEKHGVQVANRNCPGQIVISGEKTKIAAAVADSANYGFKKVIPLNVAGAYHSRLMQTAADEFEKFLTNVEFKQPRIPVFSNTNGKAIMEPAEIKQALVKQVVSSVLWEDCIQNAVLMGVSEFYECGPGKVLKGLAKRIDETVQVSSLNEYADVAELNLGEQLNK